MLEQLSVVYKAGSPWFTHCGRATGVAFNHTLGRTILLSGILFETDQKHLALKSIPRFEPTGLYL